MIVKVNNFKFQFLKVVDNTKVYKLLLNVKMQPCQPCDMYLVKLKKKTRGHVKTKRYNMHPVLVRIPQTRALFKSVSVFTVIRYTPNIDYCNYVVSVVKVSSLILIFQTFSLLNHLAKARGRVVTKDDLIAHISEEEVNTMA